MAGLQLTGDAAPEASMKVQGAIPETGQAIPLRRIRRFRQFQQGEKRVLHDVFRLGMAQSQRPAIEDQPGRLGGEEPLAPSVLWDFVSHVTQRDTADVEFV